jgi:hypothetical protein
MAPSISNCHIDITSIILYLYYSFNILRKITVASKKFWSSMSFQNLVRLSQIKKISLPDHAHVNKVSKNEKKMTIHVIQH